MLALPRICLSAGGVRGHRIWRVLGLATNPCVKRPVLQPVAQRVALGRRLAAPYNMRNVIGPYQSRNSSLIDVFERVFPSTRLTMTAQASEGPGVPSGNGFPGNAPGTTTE